ncbi:MAG: hypothetical protein ABIG35_10760 [Pseudomonadota bacterium]
MNSAVAERAKLYPSPALLSAANQQYNATAGAVKTPEFHGQPEKMAKIEIRHATQITRLVRTLDAFRRQRCSHKGKRGPLTASQSCSSLATPFDVEPGHDHDA